MATQQHIRPFPETKDRERFASWITGFCDGEAYFGLHADLGTKAQRWSPRGGLFITLRRDDREILYLIQSYFGVGKVIIYEFQNKGRSQKNLVTRYSVQNCAALANVIVPHFEKYPLEAKKKNDFELWKEGVQMMYEVSMRPRTSNGRGVSKTWTEAEREHFKALYFALKDIRKYREDPADVPKIHIPRPKPIFKQNSFLA